MRLVLDLGSSSTRALLYDDAGVAVAGPMPREVFSFAVDETGRSEDDVDAAFARVIAVIDAVAAQVPAGAEIRSICFSAYATSLVAIDLDGRARSPVFTYADTRAASAARGLRGTYDDAAALQRTGCRILANYWPGRIAWLRNTQPDVLQARWLCGLADAIAFRLSGVMRTGVSLAAWTGLLDRTSRDWDETWLAALALPRAQLPPIDRASGDAPGLLERWRARWPFLAQARLSTPVGDGAAANIGSGCVDPAHIAVTVGTTGAMRVVAPVDLAPVVLPPALWNYFVDHAHVLIGGATTEGGNVFAWARQTLRLPAGDALEAAIAAHSPDAHGLTVLPTLAGERSPGYAEDIRGTLHGLSLGTTPVDIARACMEAIAMRLATIGAVLRSTGIARPDASQVASGGALESSPSWCQMIADASGAPLILADTSEATSRGAALIAARADGQPFSSPEALGRIFVPIAAHTAIYRAAAERQQALYQKLYSR